MAHKPKKKRAARKKGVNPLIPAKRRKALSKAAKEFEKLVGKDAWKKFTK